MTCLIRSFKTSLFLLLVIFVFFSGCAFRQYPGKSLPKDQIVTILLRTGPNVITKIDKKNPCPDAAKSFFFGGGYFGLARSLSCTKAEVLPGSHTLLVDYRSSGLTSISSYVITFLSEANHKYRVNSEVGKIINSPDPSFVSYEWTVFVEDVTGPSPVRAGDAIYEQLKSLEPSTPLGFSSPESK